MSRLLWKEVLCVPRAAQSSPSPANGQFSCQSRMAERRWATMTQVQPACVISCSFSTRDPGHSGLIHNQDCGICHGAPGNFQSFATALGRNLLPLHQHKLLAPSCDDHIMDTEHLLPLPVIILLEILLFHIVRLSRIVGK